MLVKAALDYAARGWAVFPLIPNSKKPYGWSRGFKDATTNSVQIQKWWVQYPGSNIGISCGAVSKVTVIDVDVKDGHLGKESLKKLNLPATMTAQTPTLGWHLYYQYEPLVKTGTGILDGIDIRNDGSYIVGAPSTTEDGAYEWVNQEDPAVLRLEDIKAILHARRSNKQEQRNEPGEIIGEYRNKYLTSLAGSMRRKGMTENEIFHSLWKVNNERCLPPLDEKEVRSVARSIGAYPVTVVHIPEQATLVALWETLGITKSSTGSPIANLDNTVKILNGYQDFKELVWYDEFYRRIFTGWKSTRPREWSDADDISLTILFQRDFGFTRINGETISQAVRDVSRSRTRNEPRDWMSSLEWDGVSRVDAFLHDAFGADDSHYIQQASRNFWVSIAARIFSPGCQMDTMVVLEGDQGIGKSQALRAIGGKWYTEANESVTSKDFFMLLAGKLVIEIAELDSFNKAEVTRIKQVISCGVDRYRAPYARASEDYPRMSVFVGTTNEKEYLKDNTGARRFWPIECSQINLSYIQRFRDQFFAEAVDLYNSGHSWWEMPDEATKRAQEERRSIDPWEDLIRDHLIGRSETCFQDIATGPLNLSAREQDKRTQMRVANILRKVGWKRDKRWSGGQKRVWIPND